MAFLWDLSREIEQLKKRAANQGFKFAVRLNGTSDLAWHRMKVEGGGSLMQLHPDVQFYDYTKVLNYLIMILKIIMLLLATQAETIRTLLQQLRRAQTWLLCFKISYPKNGLIKKS